MSKDSSMKNVPYSLIVSQENCCRAIIGVSAIVSRAAEPSDNLREAIFSYLRNYKLTAVFRRQCFSIS